MKRLTQISLALLIIGVSVAVLLKVSPTLVTTVEAQTQGVTEDSTKSAPKDTRAHSRPAGLEDYFPSGFSPLGAETQGFNANAALMGAAEPGIFIVDVVVNNTDPNLTNTDTITDWENSLAVNPEDPDEVVILGFSGSWGNPQANAPLWHSTDGGLTWTKEFTIPRPPGLPGGGPRDQTLDYGRNGELSTTILMGNDVVSGTTDDPADATAWNWFTTGTPPVTQLTNHLGTQGNEDQPWLIVNPDPTNPNQDNVYVAYDDFDDSDGIPGPDMRVAVSYGVNPPDFTVDVQVGNGGNGVNPGHRLAGDPRTGYVYSLFGLCVSNCTGDPKNIDYYLNRTTDGGQNWSLNGNAFGIVVANADSTQPWPKYGTVNALLGNALHGAADPNTGDFYYAYGNRDSGTGNDRLAIRRVVSDGAGNVTVGAESFVTGQVEAALPQVAVADNGTVGVFYYTFDGFSSDDFPIFTAYLALSEDQGVTFTTHRLVTFLSPEKGTGIVDKQRVLGDYQQMKTLGNCFYGTFTANGAPFGRPRANTDPIFFKTCVGPVTQVPSDLTFQDTCEGATSSEILDVCNTGTENLIVESITSSDSQFVVNQPTGGFPVIISPDFCFPFEVLFTPTSEGTQSASLTIETNEPNSPPLTVQATGKVGERDIRVTGSTDFGDVCAEEQAEKTVSVCNVGPCDLSVTDASIDCDDFTLINNPFPATVSPHSCLDLVVRFTPTSAGPKQCTLTITSDDPDSPTVDLTLTANTPLPSIDVPPDQAFLPTVIQSVDACESALPFPVSSTGTCNLEITDLSITTNADEYSLSGLPSFPIILGPGDIAGQGDLNTVFAPDILDRNRLGEVSVTYISEPVTGDTTTVIRELCGEGVRTGARVLVTEGGTPMPMVKSIKLQRLGPKKNKNRLDTIDNVRNLTLQTVTPAAPCGPFQYHREYSTVSNPIQLAPGSYAVTVQAVIGGKNKKKTVGFDVSSCDFNPNIVVDF